MTNDASDDHTGNSPRLGHLSRGSRDVERANSLFENDFFRTFAVEASDRSGTRHRAHVRTRRKDTGEYVNIGFVITGNSRDEALMLARARVANELEAVLSSMPPPVEWNSAIRRVFVRISRLRRRREDFEIYCGRLLKAGGRVDDYYERNRAHQEFVTTETREIFRDVSRLSSAERAALLVSSDEVFSDPLNAWSFDDILTREYAFWFIVDPTEDEMALHEHQLQRQAESFERA